MSNITHYSLSSLQVLHSKTHYRLLSLHAQEQKQWTMNNVNHSHVHVCMCMCIDSKVNGLSLDHIFHIRIRLSKENNFSLLSLLFDIEKKIVIINRMRLKQTLNWKINFDLERINMMEFSIMYSALKAKIHYGINPKCSL